MLVRVDKNSGIRYLLFDMQVLIEESGFQFDEDGDADDVSLSLFRIRMFMDTRPFVDFMANNVQELIPDDLDENDYRVGTAPVNGPADNFRFWCIFAISNEINLKEDPDTLVDILKASAKFLYSSRNNSELLKKIINPNRYFYDKENKKDKTEFCRVLVHGTLDEFIEMAHSIDSSWYGNSSVYSLGKNYYLAIETNRDFGEYYQLESKVSEIYLKEHGNVVLADNALNKLKYIK